ncbi:hypothetical protein D9615_004270 [Tricholomella constricta]|uniref:Uncharacterized protein n=1 Tax=Tricholomella constricta TaxID=117010 RepID=A0A8H5M5G7_9AGAR|nr:hypothetical protein D9615_004270 [Tricholomella constricta]
MSPISARIKAMFDGFPKRKQPTPVLTSPLSSPIDEAPPSPVTSTRTNTSTSSETMYSNASPWRRSHDRATNRQPTMPSSFVLKIPIAPGYCF